MHREILAVLLLIFVMSGSTGCLIAAGYAGATAVQKHGEVDEEQECIEDGKVWIEGNSWTFQKGKCVAPGTTGESVGN